MAFRASDWRRGESKRSCRTKMGNQKKNWHRHVQASNRQVLGFFGCRLMYVLVVLRTRAVGVNDKKDPRFSNERIGEALSSGAG